MTRTWLSLFYLAGYLIPGGLAMAFDPRLAMHLLLAEGDYGDVFPRLVGILLLALGILVARMIGTWAERMYHGTLVARVVILTGLTGLYVRSGDPFFVALFAIVAFGFLLTFGCYLTDRARKQAR
jgi:uncharacterized membrane protein YoaK (UPF0700 family)